MHSNLIDQQPLSEKKNISWILGVISLLLVSFYGPIAWLMFRFSEQLVEKKVVSDEIAYNLLPSAFIILYQMGMFIIPIFGLIRGIKEDKLLKKKTGFIGIVMCSISLMLLLLMDFILLFASI